MRFMGGVTPNAPAYFAFLLTGINDFFTSLFYILAKLSDKA